VICGLLNCAIADASELDDTGFVLTDPRNTEWFWLRTPEPALLVFAAYLIFAYVGPRLMAKRQPLSIRGLIVVYNFAMVALSAYMCAEVCVIFSTRLETPRRWFDLDK